MCLHTRYAQLYACHISQLLPARYNKYRACVDAKPFWVPDIYNEHQHSMSADHTSSTLNPYVACWRGFETVAAENVVAVLTTYSNSFPEINIKPIDTSSPKTSSTILGILALNLSGVGAILWHVWHSAIISSSRSQV